MASQIPQLVLYRKDGSCAMVPHILLLELDLPFTPIAMRMGEDGYEGADGRMTAQDFRAINPSGYVPTIRVDGTVVTEMPAILTYIASLRPERGLTGRDDLGRSRILEWMAYLSGTLHGVGFAELWRPQRFVSADEDAGSFEAVRRGGMSVIRRCFERIETKIEGPTHAIGGRLTVVDLQLHTFWRWGTNIGVAESAKYPKFEAVAREAENLGSVKAAMHTEDQKLIFAH